MYVISMKGEEHHLVTGAANLNLVGLDLLIQALAPVLQLLASSRHAVISDAVPMVIVSADHKLSRGLSFLSQSIRRPEAGSAHVLQRQSRGAQIERPRKSADTPQCRCLSAPDLDSAPC